MAVSDPLRTTNGMNHAHSPKGTGNDIGALDRPQASGPHDTFEVLWRVGDPWQDLKPYTEEPGPLVTVTGGAVRMVDVSRGVHARMPLGTTALLGDGLELELMAVQTFTPCGLNLTGYTRDSESMSTRILYLVRPGPNGETPTSLEFGDVRNSVETHPPEPCGAMYCYRLIPPDFDSTAASTSGA